MRPTKEKRSTNFNKMTIGEISTDKRTEKWRTLLFVDPIGKWTIAHLPFIVMHIDPYSSHISLKRTNRTLWSTLILIPEK